MQKNETIKWQHQEHCFCLLHESYLFPTELVERNIRQWWGKNCSSKAVICIQDTQNSQWEHLDRTVSNHGLISRKETLLFVSLGRKKEKVNTWNDSSSVYNRCHKKRKKKNRKWSCQDMFFSGFKSILSSYRI